mmetsp:Transcript_26949/g.74315  ORF Transcript_26949/g.74315 Transcript_26949/m.74315 type:complete len:241 (+) Transcript_26949:402-1124(+)
MKRVPVPDQCVTGLHVELHFGGFHFRLAFRTFFFHVASGTFNGQPAIIFAQWRLLLLLLFLLLLPTGPSLQLFFKQLLLLRIRVLIFARLLHLFQGQRVQLLESFPFELPRRGVATTPVVGWQGQYFLQQFQHLDGIQPRLHSIAFVPRTQKVTVPGNFEEGRFDKLHPHGVGHLIQAGRVVMIKGLQNVIVESVLLRNGCELTDIVQLGLLFFEKGGRRGPLALERCSRWWWNVVGAIH